MLLDILSSTIFHRAVQSGLSEMWVLALLNCLLKALTISSGNMEWCITLPISFLISVVESFCAFDCPCKFMISIVTEEIISGYSERVRFKQDVRGLWRNL